MAETKKKMAEIGASEVTISVKDPKTGEVTSTNLAIVYPESGAPCIDVSKLPALTGFYTLDEGFQATSSCRSSITFIDGPRGILAHRGYAINELAAKSTYLEVCYLLLNGTLPSTKRQLQFFEQEVTRRMTVHERLRTFIKSFPDDSHPMATLVGTVGALSAFYCKQDVARMTEADRALACVRVIAKLPTIAAMAYRHSIGAPFVYPRKDLSLAGNFLHCCFAPILEGGQFTPPPQAFIDALDVFLILHADHEQNASTSTVRLAGSSEANPFACVASGIASLWGPMHGGANQAVISQLLEIGDEANIPQYIARAKDKSDPFKLMGFGHRVYKTLDPRAREMKRLALKCIETRKAMDLAESQEDAFITSKFPTGTTTSNDRIPRHDELHRLFQLALKLEEAALKDEYFVQRKLFPNVDFYSGLALAAMHIPLSMFTPLFALGRSIGWVSQWREYIDDPARKIGRPRQLYIGHKPRPFPTIEERELATSASKAAASRPRFTEQASFSMQTSRHSADDETYGYFF